jgi:hypothetical protein
MASHQRNPAYIKVATFALGLWLLFMQCALTYHTASIEKHKPGEQCELCVAGANFASAVPAHASFDLPFFNAISPLGADCLIVHSVLFVAYAVRAPPPFAA